jgi:hypothetical protein
MKSCDGQDEDVWSYREKSQRVVMGAMVFAAFVVGIAVLFAGSSLKEKLPFILLLLIVVAVLLWSSKRVTTVLISRKDSTIHKYEGSVIFSKSRTYSLEDFNTMALTENVRTGEEGYLMADYSLVLQGQGHSLTILSTNDRGEARRLQNDLEAYLAADSGKAPLSAVN